MKKIQQIFISYKSEYRYIAEKVRDHLIIWGYQVWLDFEQIQPGEYFRHKINEGLKDSQIVVGIATPEAIQSREVMWEWDYALSKSRLIPLIYQKFDLPYHLSSTQYIDCTGNETAAFEQLRQTILNPSPAPISTSRIKPSPPLNSNRETILNLVRSTWVEGVLHATLRENQALNVPRSLAPDRVLRHLDFGDYALPPDADILQIFEDMQRELLILGDPGAGKTILMLQLAEKLIAQAHTDPIKPIPVVLNLASWAAKPKQSLHDWLIVALNTVYHINKKLAIQWVNGENLLLLLDGLDEVAIEHRNTCVDAINIFHSQYQLVDIVVCSRVKDYDVLTHRLDLRSGLLLEGLRDAQIEAYLSDDAYEGLREVMSKDEVLKTFAQTPFLLNIMGTVYRNRTPIGLQLHQTLDSTTTRRDNLMNHFVNLRLAEARHSKYTPTQIRRYLIWLAKNMVQDNRIVLKVKDLSPHWLPSRQKQQYEDAVNVIESLISGVIGGVISGAIVSLLSGPIFVVIWSVLSGLIVGLFKSRLQSSRLVREFEGMERTITVVLVSPCILSLPSAIFFGMFSCVVGMVLLGISEDIFFSTLGGIVWGVIWGLILGVLLGAIGNGFPILQYIILRIFLIYYDYTPINYAEFLTYCTEDLQLLRGAEGSFLFRHRTLLEYFAAQYGAGDFC